LISNLKAELAAQTALAREAARLKTQLECSEARVEGLQAKATEMTTSLSDAKTEIKALSTKLAASRSGDATNVKTPGSALKAASSTGRPLSSQELAAQMKEDLYGDLTGLIVRGIKREATEDVFDCLQTGRNGSKFFLLLLRPYINPAI
jgi:chromosome segregation ATPase